MARSDRGLPLSRLQDVRKSNEPISAKLPILVSNGDISHCMRLIQFLGIRSF